jgi:hypothetical protein
VNRLANAMPGAALIGFGLMTLLHGDGPTRVGGILAVLGVVLAYRGYRLAVETRSNSLTVWGMLRTRVIPRAAISEVTDYPAVVWTNAQGKVRWSPVLAFLTPQRALPGVAEHHAACVKRLRQWARRR